MDESGNTDKDRFFILGILMVRNEQIAELLNFLASIHSRIKARSEERAAQRIDYEYSAGNIEKVLSRAKTHNSFEMKFSAIHNENEDIYCEILEKYFILPDIRFCALVMDRHNLNFQLKKMSHWKRYLHNAETLIVNNFTRSDMDEFTVIADYITQPKNTPHYENTLLHNVRSRLVSMGLDAESAWGVLRLESHSSTLLQLVDILVGAVAYEVNKKNQTRKEKFVKLLREKLGAGQRLEEDFTKTSPNYFSVWKFESKNELGGGSRRRAPLPSRYFLL